MNAYLPTENLRLGADYKPHRAEHPFPVSGRWRIVCQGRAAVRRPGECRKNDSGSMCPSYMVTLEEEHSTRGRAHMLFEMLQGEVVRGGWQDEQVKKSPRPVPFLQSVQIGMPDERGHCHLQG